VRGRQDRLRKVKEGVEVLVPKVEMHSMVVFE
jgi:hypothetical protein